MVIFPNFAVTSPRIFKQICKTALLFSDHKILELTRNDGMDQCNAPGASAGVQHKGHCGWVTVCITLPASSTKRMAFVYETEAYVTKNYHK